uniref:Pyruvate formate lyase activating enzyme n=1 Tax=Candidatus Kentrum eta TaxID=2126337 RepID=A0A450V7Z2_9GAMM|nr:MAG: pyruvate formate lyase activating enzyme [Candidatus Kentron sp. H]VFK01405.1 MAG: pyruvate formate lyase activating enzyme [Candidatus Kentron sp. H]VFK04789.1 MAG: pyruvate formate lyase activating enzyme [Candidatus Kentron sp. H]
MPSDYFPTRHWHRLSGDGNGNRVQCDVCPRGCTPKEGQRGLCFVRMNQGNAIVLTTHGRSSGFAVDPVEKKPLNHFLPGTPILSFGTAGCNLTCKFCQNWHMSKARRMDRLMDRASPQEVLGMAERYGCKSVAYTYNDPVIFMEYAMDIARACRARGILSAAVTAGYIHGEARKAFFAQMDAANVDLKGFTEEFYRKLCSGQLRPVLDTLHYLRHETEIWLELTTLLIPGLNDSDRALDGMTRWVVENLGPNVPMHFTAFHPDYRMRQIPPTPLTTLRRAREIAIGNGVRYAYTGNIHDPEGQSTYCHHCGACVIGRNRYALTAWRLTETGHCVECGTPCSGVFQSVS